MALGRSVFQQPSRLMHRCGHSHSSRHSQRRRLQVVRADADYYQTLGVGKDADKKALKAAYRSGSCSLNSK